MSIPWAWFFLILATYPWLLAADLLSSTLANSGFNYFITGAALIAPCRRLKRWQAVIFAGVLGFIFEAYRPVPNGLVALTLILGAILLGNYRINLRTSLSTFQWAAVTNAGVALVWFLGAGYLCQVKTDVFNLLYQASLQAAVSGLMGLFFVAPIAVTQNWVLDSMGVPDAQDLL